MEERGSGPIEDSLNVALHIVLMTSTNPRKALELALVVTISNPFFGSEGIVVRGIVLWFDAVITQKCFKKVFALERFSGCQVCLVSMENEICCVVNEYSFSNKLLGFVCPVCEPVDQRWWTCTGHKRCNCQAGGCQQHLGLPRRRRLDALD